MNAMLTPTELHMTIGNNGSAMITEDGEAIEVDRCVRTSTGFYFEGIRRDGSETKFDVPQVMADDDMFQVVSKTSVNWPW